MTDIQNIEQANSKEAKQDSSNKLLEDSGFMRTTSVAEPGAGEIIPGQFIVTLKEQPQGNGLAAPRAQEDAAQVMSRVGLRSNSPELQVYEHAISGFAAKLSPQQLARLQNDPSVAAIEPDRMIRLEPATPGIPTLAPSQEIPNGINRIEGRLSNTAKASNGVDVDIAVLDTGINLKHSDLNVVSNISFVEGTTTGDDDNGHGSHVAGTIAAKDDGKGVTGVAPGARLWAVKVLNSEGSGSLSSVVAGIDYIASNADKIDVVNMSLGVPRTIDVINRAIDGAVDAGVSFAVAVGNDNMDSSSDTPASHPKVLAVSAVADNDGIGGGKGGKVDWEQARILGKMDDDTLAIFSNFGENVRIAAPGVATESTWKANETNSDTFNSISGTSMASPHVAGALGLIKSKHPDMKPADVYNAVIAAAKPQDDPIYGFKGDSDNFKEPMLNVANL